MNEPELNTIAHCIAPRGSASPASTVFNTRRDAASTASPQHAHANLLPTASALTSVDAAF
jgi:hypothetical protein